MSFPVEYDCCQFTSVLFFVFFFNFHVNVVIMYKICVLVPDDLICSRQVFNQAACGPTCSREYARQVDLRGSSPITPPSNMVRGCGIKLISMLSGGLWFLSRSAQFPTTMQKAVSRGISEVLLKWLQSKTWITHSNLIKVNYCYQMVYIVLMVLIMY